MATRKKKALHVSRSKGNGKAWGVTGTTKAPGTFKKQATAVKKAKAVGRAEKRTVAVHGRDGKIKRVLRPYCGKGRTH